MSRLIDRGRAFLVRAAGFAAGIVTLTYTQVGTGLSLTLSAKAWAGKPGFRSTLDGASTIEFGDRDYLIPAEDLVLSGAQFLPQRGDQLTQTLAGVSKVYEVITPDTSEPAWRWADDEQTLLRLHTKQVQ